MFLHKKIEKIDAVITFIEEWLVYILMSGMLLVVFFGVVNRSFFNISIPWSEEVARYLMIWCVFVGASLGVKRSVHISVDTLVIILPSKVKRIFEILSYAVCFIFCSCFFYIGAEFIGRMMTMGQLSPALRMPMYIAYAAVPCGFALMSMRYLINVVYFFFEVREVSAETAYRKEDAYVLSEESAR